MHDPTLDRTTNGKGLISDMMSADIDKLDAGSWFNEKFTGTHVPKISEMLDSLRGKAKVFFDVKPGTPVATLAKLVRNKGFADKSFFWFGDTTMLKEFVKIAPDMCIKVNVSDVAGIKRWMRMCKPSYIEIGARNITDDIRSFCRSNGIKIMAIAFDSSDEAYREVVMKQPDMVNLDRPEKFLKIVSDVKEEKRIKQSPLSQYADPRIGSEGLGRVFIGPSWPYGMAKPSPDCTVNPNSGWLPMPEQVNGFAQVHVSGTGGGPKYGNILVMPFIGELKGTSHPDIRDTETIRLGYYSAKMLYSGIKTEITTARRASFYKFTYPSASDKALLVDAGFFLAKARCPTPARHNSL